jgi:hypothetical protein
MRYRWTMSDIKIVAISANLLSGYFAGEEKLKTYISY